jgi:hypothetical protein
MRFAVFLALLGACTMVAPASAETHTFVIANAPDGYGVDQCLSTGARCGTAIADAYCQSREFQRAASFRKVTATDVTGSIALAAETPRGTNALVAIECAR